MVTFGVLASDRFTVTSKVQLAPSSVVIDKLGPAVSSVDTGTEYVPVTIGDHAYDFCAFIDGQYDYDFRKGWYHTILRVSLSD